MYQPKAVREDQDLMKIPILKAFGEKVFLSRNTEDSRFVKKPLLLEEEWAKKNKMILVAKKIGCYVEPPLYLQGLKEYKREEGKY